MHMQGVQGYHLEVVGKIQVKVALKNIEKHAKNIARRSLMLSNGYLDFLQDKQKL